jgi:hypothetical protein
MFEIKAYRQLVRRHLIEGRRTRTAVHGMGFAKNIRVPGSFDLVALRTQHRQQMRAKRPGGMHREIRNAHIVQRQYIISI